jgi:hypothetical protein
MPEALEAPKIGLIITIVNRNNYRELNICTIFTKHNLINHMKKFLLSIVAVALVGVSVTSCKSHEKCPAYSKVNTESKKSI